ncbi:putative selenium-dependent hydroxylase accessory protein YqeC [Geomonas sp. Red51]|nr:putative selenium-dependent hydroxylase accessory protein YqeC [Geomonas azotofigens]
MFCLARELAAAGRTVLTTTTTRIFMPGGADTDRLVVVPDPQQVLQLAALSPGRRVAAGSSVTDSGKLIGYRGNAIGIFAASPVFNWVLVEADGAARRPLKAPAEHEPVVPSASTAVVAVAGLDALGKAFGADSVFRNEEASAIMGIGPGDEITEEAVARLFIHPLGVFKGAPPGARRIVFLNKADDAEREAKGARVAALLRERSGAAVDAVVVGAAAQGRIALVVQLER